MNFAQAYELPAEGINDTVPRVDVRTTSIAEFRRKFEALYKPVVLSHSQDGWLAEKKWTLKVRKRKAKDGCFRRDLLCYPGEVSLIWCDWHISMIDSVAFHNSVA